jgi:cell division protein FtsB
VGHLPEDEVTLTKRPTLLLIVLLFLVIGAAFLTQLIPYRQILDSNHQVASAREQLASLEVENRLLAADVEALETPEEIEKLAREKLGYSRPGETVYVVLDPPRPAGSVDVDPPEELVVDRTWVERIWDFLSGADVGS